LGQRIKRIRNQRGMSLAKVVRDDFSRAFLNQVELGKARPSIRVLRIIADRLGTEVEYLLEGQEAGIERELALERGRVLAARGEPRRALLALKPALTSFDWPLGSDARVCQAQCLIALGRKPEAAAILEKERTVIDCNDYGWSSAAGSFGSRGTWSKRISTSPTAPHAKAPTTTSSSTTVRRGC
jgi:transcriptional regulator with XRE-family HTH domain